MALFSKDPLQIIIFLSYGTNNQLYIRGRALQDENINLEKSNIFSLLVNSWKRFESDEVKNTSLTLTLPNQHKIIAHTDNSGYFIIKKEIENLSVLANSEGWVTFEIGYTDADQGRKINKNNKFIGSFLIPSENAVFGVASDIDDTILHTGVISRLKWKLILNTLFISPFKRKAIEGTSQFYSLLHQGKTKVEANPIFYVSHSPWNMYLYLDYFLQKNNFPKGAILLRSVSHMMGKKTDNTLSRKQIEIVHILETYPNLPFILIGDAGEHDADIYMEITKNYPNRIKAIYLRSVNHSKKMARIKTLIENYSDTEFKIVNSSEDAILHAKKHHFIA